MAPKLREEGATLSPRSEQTGQMSNSQAHRLALLFPLLLALCTRDNHEAGSPWQCGPEPSQYATAGMLLALRFGGSILAARHFPTLKAATFRSQRGPPDKGVVAAGGAAEPGGWFGHFQWSGSNGLAWSSDRCRM